MKDENFPKFEFSYKINEEEAIKRIKIICDYKNYRFDGFVGDKWEGIYTKLKLHCNICGNNWESCNYNNFRNNKGCTQCAKQKVGEASRYDLLEALNKIKNICKEKNYRFDGFAEEWKGVYTKLKLHCNICGYDWSTVSYSSFSCGHGCPQCGGRMKNSNEKVLQNINEICQKKNYRFDGFVNGEYQNKNSKLKLHCNICGYDWDTCSYHNFVSHNRGCPQCNGGIKLNEKEAIQRIKEECERRGYIFHDFIGKIYKNNNVKLKLECKKCGNIWSSSTYNSFVNNKIGCPKCNFSHLEKEIEILLKENNIIYETQQIFDWLKYKSNLKLDFYIPSKKIAIECQGIQHFKDGHWEGFDGFKLTKKRDEIKRKLCEEHGIKILYYSNLGIVYPYHVYEDKKELIKKLLE